MKSKIVHLRGYRAKSGLTQLAYDSNGKIINESHTTKVRYGVKEWVTFLNQINSLGFIKVEVCNVFEESEREIGKIPTYSEISIPEEIKQEVKDAFYGKSEDVRMTPEQLEIAELREAVKALSSGSGSDKDVQPRTRRTKAEIEADNK